MGWRTAAIGGPCSARSTNTSGWCSSRGRIRFIRWFRWRSPIWKYSSTSRRTSLLLLLTWRQSLKSMHWLISARISDIKWRNIQSSTHRLGPIRYKPIIILVSRCGLWETWYLMLNRPIKGQSNPNRSSRYRLSLRSSKKCRILLSPITSSTPPYSAIPSPVLPTKAAWCALTAAVPNNHSAPSLPSKTTHSRIRSTRLTARSSSSVLWVSVLHRQFKTSR